MAVINSQDSVQTGLNENCIATYDNSSLLFDMLVQCQTICILVPHRMDHRPKDSPIRVDNSHNVDTGENRAKLEQSTFGLSSNGDRTMSHAHTSAPDVSSSQQGRTGEDRDPRNSVLSYNSIRDVRLFVKEMHGR